MLIMATSPFQNACLVRYITCCGVLVSQYRINDCCKRDAMRKGLKLFQFVIRRHHALV